MIKYVKKLFTTVFCGAKSATNVADGLARETAGVATGVAMGTAGLAVSAAGKVIDSTIDVGSEIWKLTSNLSTDAQEAVIGNVYTKCTLPIRLEHWGGAEQYNIIIDFDTFFQRASDIMGRPSVVAVVTAGRNDMDRTVLSERLYQTYMEEMRQREEQRGEDITTSTESRERFAKNISSLTKGGVEMVLTNKITAAAGPLGWGYMVLSNSGSIKEMLLSALRLPWDVYSAGKEVVTGPVAQQLLEQEIADQKELLLKTMKGWEIQIDEDLSAIAEATDPGFSST